MSVRTNVVANYLGQGWRALAQLAFVPVYIRYLGVESYGLISIFVMLQTWLVLLDFGMRPALSREMARFSAGAQSAQSIRDLMRSVEWIGAGITVLVGLAIWASSAWLSVHWLKVTAIPAETVTRSFMVMGGVVALRFMESIYVSALVGLQRQTLENAVGATMATVRAGGAAIVVVWISPTIVSFFFWQAIVSVLSVVVLSVVTWRVLPSGGAPAQFSWSSLRQIRRFAAGMMVSSSLSLLLTQVDKLLLSKMLLLEDFAYYGLAASVAGVVLFFAGPVGTAFYPRFTVLATTRDDAAIRVAYHQSAQLLGVLVGAAATVLVVFGDQLLLLWTSDANLVAQVAPVMAVLTVGNFLNALVWLPYQLQLAHGWTMLAISMNIVAVVVLVPTLLVVVPSQGAMGAAWIWVVLNAGFVMVVVYLMHRRLLRGEMWTWYRRDVAAPLCTAVAVALLTRWLFPSSESVLMQSALLALCSAVVLLAAIAVAPIVRGWLCATINRSVSLIVARRLP